MNVPGDGGRDAARTLALLVRDMRQAQKDFFAARKSGRDSSASLTESKRFERAVDIAVKQVLDDKPKLPGFGWGEQHA